MNTSACGGYNHEAKQCSGTLSSVICADNHNSNNCKCSEKCVISIRANQKMKLNLEVNHSATDSQCKCYLRTVAEKDRILI